MKQIKRTRGFTLIELLVVITIIGLLAGLAVPAIGRALDNAKQTADVANARQLGIILFSIANDENGVYPVGARDDTTGVRTNASTSTDLFKSMLKDKELPDAKILSTNGKTPYKGSTSDPTALAANNVGWDYYRGVTTTDESSLPLVLSTGAYAAPSNFSDTTIATTGIWKDKGVVVYTIGNSALFNKARSGGKVDKLIDTSVTPPTGAVLVKP